MGWQIAGLNSQWPPLLTSLSLDLTRVDESEYLPKLRLPETITSLSLGLHPKIDSLAALTLPMKLAWLEIALDTSQLSSLRNLPMPKSLTSVELKLSGSRFSDFPSDLHWPPQLISLSLSGLDYDAHDLKPLKVPASLTCLKLNAEQLVDETVRSLSEKVTCLSVEVKESNIESLTALRLSNGVTSLSLKLFLSGIRRLSDVVWPPKLTSLSLDLGSEVKRYREIAGIQEFDVTEA